MLYIRHSNLELRSIHVFVSSTFRDMIENRNELMTHCWPALRKFCAERHMELTEVDLRWGISEEQGTRKETLSGWHSHKNRYELDQIKKERQ